MKPRAIRSRAAVVAWSVAALFGLAAALWLYDGSTRVVANKRRVNLPHLSPADDGFRIAVLSDPHFGPGDAGRADRIAGMLNAMDPEIVVLLGDFVNGAPDPRRSLSMPELTEFVRKLKARRGVFAVTGNHELWYGREAVAAALERGGAVLLENRVAKIAAPSGGTIQLVGLPDYTTEDPPEKFPPVDPALPTLVLMHDPNSAKFVPPDLPCFCIAGHTHGGQLRIWPGGGDRTSLRLALIRIRDKLGQLPDALRPYVLFDRGFTDYRGRKIFITSGAGSAQLAVRTFCQPEVVQLELHSADPEAARNVFMIPEEL